MRPDRMLLSAYLDGEVPERFIPELEAELAASPEAMQDYQELLALRRRLLALPMPDPFASAERSLVSIGRRVSLPRPAPWRRDVRIPLPALAAAVLVVVLAGVTLATALSPRVPGAVDSLSSSRSVDVTIRVDGDQMDSVLQWLVDKNMLGEVNIQLPETRFQVVGEPVLLRASDGGGGHR